MNITNYFINKNVNTFNKENDKNLLNTNINNKSLKISIPSQSIQEQANYFTCREPKQWFSIHRNAKGMIDFTLPSLLKEKKRVIYVFKNEEKQRYLIGKTGDGLIERCSKYASWINKKENEKWVKGEGKKAFLNDIKKHPEHFKVGILSYLQPDDDLNHFESQFIEHKRKIYQLYNDRNGGGGGLAHAEEELTTYAIPKNTTVFTPTKYYHYKKNARGYIRPAFSPNFKKKIRELEKEMENTQEFAYVIKHLVSGKRYIGITAFLIKRLREHGYFADYSDKSSDKYNPTHGKGLIDKAIAQEPENFVFGVLPLKSLLKIKEKERKNYRFLSSIAKVEKAIIKIKKAHKSQHGYNCNWGGGGPISSRAKKPIARTLNYE